MRGCRSMSFVECFRCVIESSIMRVSLWSFKMRIKGWLTIFWVVLLVLLSLNSELPNYLLKDPNLFLQSLLFIRLRILFFLYYWICYLIINEAWCYPELFFLLEAWLFDLNSSWDRYNWRVVVRDSFLFLIYFTYIHILFNNFIICKFFNRSIIQWSFWRFLYFIWIIFQFIEMSFKLL